MCCLRATSSKSARADKYREEKELRKPENELSSKTKVWRSKSRGICEQCQNQAETKALAFPRRHQGTWGGPRVGVPIPTAAARAGVLPGTHTQTRGHRRSTPAPAKWHVPAGLLNISLNFRTTLRALEFPPFSYTCICCARSIPSRKVCSILLFLHSTLPIYSPAVLSCPLAYLPPGTCALNSSVVSPSAITPLRFPQALCREIKVAGMLRYGGDGEYPRKKTGITDDCLE